MNLVPWFPEIAVLAGAAALVPGLLALRRAPHRPTLSAFVEPAAVALIVLAVLDGLVSARTGASFAVGAAAALAIQWMAAFGIAAPALRLSAWGTVLVSLGLIFELFGGAAGLDDGGWRLFAQLVTAFGLGSALVTATGAATDSAVESTDAGAFAVTGAIVIASATPLVANRVDGVAFPVLIATAALAAGVVALLWKGGPRISLVLAGAVVALLVAFVAAGLDPVAMTHHDTALDPRAPLIAALVGVLLGTVMGMVGWKWVVALAVASAIPFHLLGPYGTAMGALGVLTVLAPASCPGQAATVVTGVALLAASHSGSPLMLPSHLHGWLWAVLGVLAPAGVIWVIGKGPRFAVLRVAFLLWIAMGPFLAGH